VVRKLAVPTSLADTMDFGSREFTRQFNGQLDKEGLVIDVRWNEGGHVPFHILDVLARRRDAYSHEFRRRAGGRRMPDYLHDGPLCLLTNGVTVSGGDELAYLFQKRGLGKIVGTRTMGGMIGVGGGPLSDLKFVDGGGSTIPIVGFYDEEGKWIIEGYGVEPDIQVLEDPARMLDGADPQLDVAIDTVLEQLGASRTTPPVP
jgi:tricorn protease